jgi:hypothetical protein
MTASSAAVNKPITAIRGKIVEAEVKQSVDPARPLPLVSALYAIEAPEGFWLCAYYGMNRSVFDFLPQRGAEVDEKRLGFVFHVKEFHARDEYQPAHWEEFKKRCMMVLGGGGE